MKPPRLTGYQTAYSNEKHPGELEVCIYGDPAGLRSLAKLLNFIADLDQTKEPFPDEHDSYHHHVFVAGQYRGHSQQITLGRADDKKGRKRFDVFPKPSKKA